MAIDQDELNRLIPEITSASERKAILSALGLDVQNQKRTTADAVTRLRDVAFREFVAWLTGARRYESISTMERDRLIAVFCDMRSSPPSIAALVDDLHYPEGRAVAMLSRMRFGNAKRLDALRARDLADLIENNPPRPTVADNGADPRVFTAEDTHALMRSLRKMAQEPAGAKIEEPVDPKPKGHK